MKRTLILVATAALVVTMAPPASAAIPYKGYKDCAAMQRVYPHGVGRSGAVDSTSGTRVRNFFVSTRLYLMNDNRVSSAGQYDLDRDNDGIACEKR
ncbi:MAG: calcium-binding protein [Frankiales bacterium]|nr:calcium-binding protein [Frankiales bacterium]